MAGGKRLGAVVSGAAELWSVLADAEPVGFGCGGCSLVDQRDSGWRTCRRAGLEVFVEERFVVLSRGRSGRDVCGEPEVEKDLAYDIGLGEEEEEQGLRTPPTQMAVKLDHLLGRAQERRQCE